MSRIRRVAASAASFVALAMVGATAASADTVTVGNSVQVSGASPIPESCIGDENAPPPSANVYNSEVEPYVAVDPTDPMHLVGAWQQDRWNTGGARGLVTATSFDGGQTWELNDVTKSSVCTGGTAANGGNYERASDPWVSIAPDGTTYLMSLSVDTNPGGFGLHPNAMLAMRSDDGGLTWEDPITLRRDDELGTALNDKNTLTADPLDADFAYAVWDRLVGPPGEPPTPVPFENAIVGRGPTWFARTTNGGESWEPARIIFQPGTNNQTIGNQIAVTGSGDLVNAFDLIRTFGNPQGTRGFNIAVIRSEDNGDSWDKQATIVDRHFSFQGVVIDPDNPDPNTRRVRTGDILPEIATDLGSEAVYLVWQDMRFGPRSSVAFSQSLDGGETWSPTVRINQTPDLANDLNEQAFTPMVRVADDGTVTVTYYDFRAEEDEAAPGTALNTDAFAIHCHAHEVDCSDPDNWTDEVRLTDQSFDMRQAPFANGSFVGDYVGLDTDGSTMFPFWSMPSDGDPANVFVRTLTPSE
jgi:Neuraminidase (sialidase)